MVKLKDIAQETGLTISTVSKALNNSHEISAETTKRVIATAEALGYRMKRSFEKKEGKTIGAILPEVRSHTYAEILHALSAAANRQGYMLITVLTDSFTHDVAPYIERLLQHGLDGIFISNVVGLSPVAQKLLRDNNIPAVVLKNIDTDELYGIDSIYIKDTAAIYLAVDHLTELGHTQIGFLGEKLSFIRCEAFLEAMKQHNLEVNPAFVKQGHERFERGGYLRALELLKEPELPTAVLTSYDQFAYGATRAFLEYGLRIPEDISIIGYDNVDQSAYYPVPLTSTSNPVELMGTTAVNILIDAIQSPSTHVVQSIAMQGRLVVRTSTCPPKAKQQGGTLENESERIENRLVPD